MNDLDDFNLYTSRIRYHEKVVNIFGSPWGSNNGYSKELRMLYGGMERVVFLIHWNVSAMTSVGNLHTVLFLRRNIKEGSEPTISHYPNA